MRQELYELFGDCKYFHAGLDEAYAFSIEPKFRKVLPEYLTMVAKEILAEGRRPMLWMDMFLPKESGTKHLCSCTIEQMEDFLHSIPEETILIDWNYEATNSPLPTSKYLREKAKQDVIIAPWDNMRNIDAATATA